MYVVILNLVVSTHARVCNSQVVPSPLLGMCSLATWISVYDIKCITRHALLLLESDLIIRVIIEVLVNRG
jgi:hypothetical protein